VRSVDDCHVLAHVQLTLGAFMHDRINMPKAEIGGFWAFLLLLFLSLVSPWLLVLATGGLALIPALLFPKLLVAVFPFLFATIVPLYVGLPLTLLMWVALSVLFSREVASLGFRQAFERALIWLGMVWLATPVVALAFDIEVFRTPFRL
jgi:hypothetical protein